MQLPTKTRIQKRAERTGKKLSELCGEALLTGEIIAVPQLGEHERKAIRVLQRVAYFFSHSSNLIQKKDPSWAPLAENLSYISLHAFQRFYSSRHRITDEVYDLLNIKRVPLQVIIVSILWLFKTVCLKALRSFLNHYLPIQQ